MTAKTWCFNREAGSNGGGGEHKIHMNGGKTQQTDSRVKEINQIKFHEVNKRRRKGKWVAMGWEGHSFEQSISDFTIQSIQKLSASF